ncbi:MAG TPA: hypothetical protein VEY06_03040 [Flavisolibacter sp.]|nr:hypothetical protein [Flavisolibacter sp.]
MKKSNRILLGIFLTAVLLVAAVHVTLYAKYRSGDYTVLDDMQSMVMQSFPHVKFVSVSNMSVSIGFADSAQVEKTEDKEIRFYQKSDTLHIVGTDSSDNGKYNHFLTINLPINTSVSGYNTALSFVNRTEVGPQNFSMYLNNSELLFSDRREGGDDKSNKIKPVSFGNVKVTAMNNSVVAIDDTHTVIDNLDLELANSSIRDNKGSIGRLSIKTDSLSHISLQAKHFFHVKSNTAVNE